VIVDQAELYRRLEEADSFGLLRLDGAEPRDSALPLFHGGRVAGSMSRAHDLDESLSASVLLENLGCKATGALALEHLLRTTGFPPDDVPYAIGSGEEAVGDRYQRGGGNLAKAIAEAAGCRNASGADVKAFCCGPIHALVVAASLVAAGVYPHVVVVAGGSLAKLGMKFTGALRLGIPVLEDVLAGFAVLVGPPGDGAPEIRLDAVGRHRVGSGSAQQAVLEDLVVEPLERIGRGILDVDRYATELHDPEITEPAGAATTGSWALSPSGAGSSRGMSSTASSALTACRASPRRRATSPPRCPGCRTACAPCARARSARRCSSPRARSSSGA
jgi:hypothetical protein